MTKQEVVKYWLNSANDAWDTAQTLLKSQKYHHALFFVHLAIEKSLKALHLVRTSQPAPPLHNLSVLAKRCKVPLTKRQITALQEISSFNIAARYDDYKLNFYKKAKREYATKWLREGEILYRAFLSILKENQ